MTTMQWIALSIGILLLATRLPALIWPGPYRRKVLDVCSARRDADPRHRRLPRRSW